MERETPIDEELIALAGALRTLRPSSSRFDRDALLFSAGRASVVGTLLDLPRRQSHPHRQWIWPLTMAVSLAVALATITWHGAEIPSTTSDSGKSVSVPITERGRETVAALSVLQTFDRSAPTYLLQLERAVAGNLDADRPETSGGTPTDPPLSRDRLLKELLEETLL